MKKAICMFLTVLMILSLAACGSGQQEAKTEAKTEAKSETKAEEGFSPALDTSTSCHISIAGGYDNFEALENEFDRFNEYYPQVELVFRKVDDFNNMIGTVLNSKSGLHPQQYHAEHGRRYSPHGSGLRKHLRHACEQQPF